MKTTGFAIRQWLLLLLLTLSAGAFSASAQDPQPVIGDVNLDNEVTVADINAVIDVILSDGTNSAADVNGDGEINIADINAVIDIILGGDPKTLCSTLIVTTRDGRTTEHIIDQNTRMSIEKPNLVIETGGTRLTYDLENTARLRYGHRYVSAAPSAPVVLYEDGISPDADERPQYALFTYRNDGAMNAFLNIDVDSITYSNTDLDGLAHPNAVVQQVWTPDSLYRIPLAAIDSIGFKAPSTEYKPDVIIIDERHMPYIIAADDLSITFKSNVPTDMVPAIGQIMYSDLEEDPFYMGFAGRVVGIEHKTGEVKYICAPVSPDEVYVRCLDFFKVITDSTEVVDDNELARAPKRSWFGIADDGTITIPEHKWKLDLNLNKLTGGEGNITNEGKIFNEFEYVICVGMLENDFVYVKHTKKISHSTKASMKCVKAEYKPEPMWMDAPVTLVGCKYLGVNLYPGLFFEAKAGLDIVAELPYESNQVEEYYFGSDQGWSPMVMKTDNGGWPGFEDFIQGGKVTVKLSGSVAFGPVVRAAIVVWKPGFLSFDVRAKGGLELSAEVSYSSDDAVDWQNNDDYYTLLSNTKISTGLKVGLELVGTAKDKEFTFASASTTLFKRDRYLVPKFTVPALPQYTGGTWEGSVTPTSMFTTPSNELLLPGKVGIGVYEQNGTFVRSNYFDSLYFGTEDNWPQNAVQCSMTGLEAGHEYIVRPLFKMLNLINIKGGPRTVFYSPEPMTLEKPSLELIKGTRGDVAISGGWGFFTASTSNSKVATVKVTKRYVNGVETSLVRVDAVSPGDAVITVKDVRSGDVIKLPVHVIDGQNKPLYVAEEALDFGVVATGTNTSKTLTLINNTTSPKTVTATVTGPFSFQQGNSSTSSLTVEVPGNSCSYVTVQFTASGQGASTGSVTFVNELFDGGKCIVPMTAYATSNTAPLYVEQQSLDLGEVPMGSTRTGELTIVNNSSSAQTVVAAIDAPFSFSQGQNSTSTLTIQVPSRSRSTVTVLYTATVAGEVAGNATLTADAFQDGQCVVSVQAFTPADGQSLYIEQQSLDLGDVLAGETRTGELTIVNNTAAAKTLTCSVDAPFWFKQGESCVSGTTVVVPGNSCGSVTVQFTATTPGDYSGNVTFKNTELDGGQCVVPVQARAVDNSMPQTEVITVGDVTFKMVHVEGGTFMMGAADDDSEARPLEKPAHQVTLSGYSIGETEVTQALWVAVMGTNPSTFANKMNHPVEHLNWNNCQEFISKLNQITGKSFRLPTEAEWEFAARGGNKSLGYKYAGSNSINEVAWWGYFDGGNSGWTTHPVAQLLPNELGLYDMSGNVYEWCQDWIGSYNSSEQINPIGPESGSVHVYRGGCWYSGQRGCCVSYRTSDNPSYWDGTLGLRLAMSDNTQDDHEWVDLGLPGGTLWATCNVGASSPEDYGDYFAWGETAPKDTYDRSTYKWFNGSYDIYNTLTKYCTKSSFGYNGFVDNKTELDPEDDAAYVNWGPSWRMPTTEQQRELYEKCSSVWTTQNGVNGRLFTGPNGNTLFLPAAGYRYGSLYDAGLWGGYWSRTLDSGGPNCAYYLDFHSGYVNWNSGHRYGGLAVRAVRVSQN